MKVLLTILLGVFEVSTLLFGVVVIWELKGGSSLGHILGAVMLSSLYSLVLILLFGNLNSGLKSEQTTNL